MEKRASRVSGKQWELLLDFLEKNPCLAKGYNNTSQGRRESHRLWQEITPLLNDQKSGVTKTPKEWAIYVSNYKSKLKKLVTSYNADATSGAEGGPPQDLHSNLSEYEARFLAVLGGGFGQTAPAVKVDPFPNQVSKGTGHRGNSSCDGSVSPSSEGCNSTSGSNRRSRFHRASRCHYRSPSPITTTFTPKMSRTKSLLSNTCTTRRRLRTQDSARSRGAAQTQALKRIGRNIGQMANAMELIGGNLGRLANAAERFLSHIIEPE